MTEERPDPPDHRLTRRQTLGIAGAAGTAVVLGGGAGKLISHLAEDPDEVTAASAAKSCKLTPELTEGPFYVAFDRIRKDITEGRPGVSLTLKIRVIDVKKCAPIHSAAVDGAHRGQVPRRRAARRPRLPHRAALLRRVGQLECVLPLSVQLRHRAANAQRFGQHLLGGRWP